MATSQQKLEAQERFISIIIPCFNEEANIEDCIAAVTEVMDKGQDDYEIIAVNDGSSDNTLQVLNQLESGRPNLVVLDMMRNFGQTAAYQAGLDVARGSHILFFSGDLEIPADQIPKVVEHLDAGNDFVNTLRTDRWGGSHALKSRLANRILNHISGLSLLDRGSGLKGMSGQLAKSLQLYGEWHRFLPDLASIYTARIVEFEVPFEERKAGVSSYKGRLKSASVFFDLATVAFTIHSQRKPYQSDTLLKRLTAVAFYKVYNQLSDIKAIPHVGDCRLMDRRVVESLSSLQERARFMKGLFAWVGFTSTVVEFEQQPRHSGESKLSFWKLWDFALDGVTSFSTFPLRVWSYLGFSIALLSFIYGFWIILRTLILGVEVPGYASLLSAVLICAIGVSYLGHLRLSFQVDWNQADHLNRLPRFVIVALGGFALSQLALGLAFGLLHFPLSLALGAAVVVIPAVTFVANRVWVFRQCDGWGTKCSGAAH